MRGFTQLGRVNRLGNVQYLGYDYYVDSVNGDDSYSGKNAAQAYQSIAALSGKIETGTRIGLARGSHWREQLIIADNNVIVGTYGTGARPILDASDIVPNESFSKTAGRTNIYQVTITVTAGWTSAWEDDVRLVRVADLDTCDSTAGSYKCVDAVGSMILYVHATDSSDLTANGKVYEATTRACGIFAPGVTGTKITGIHCKRNRSDSGSLVASNFTTLFDCLATEGTKHNIYVGQGSYLQGCVAQDAYYGAGAPGGKTYFIANCDVGSDQPVTFVDCQAINTGVYDDYATGFYCHTNTSGLFGTIFYLNCQASNISCAFDAFSTHLMVVSGCVSDGCRTLANCRVDTNIIGGAFTNGSALSCAVHVETKGKTISISGGLQIGEAVSWDGGAIYGLVQTTISIVNSSVIIPSRGITVYLPADLCVLTASGNTYLSNSGWYYYYLTGPNSSLTSDNNHFVLESPNFMVNGVEYINVALYQAGTGQDAHSTIG